MATDRPTIRRDDIELLRVIARLPYAPEQQELAERLGVSKATISRRVTRLVEAGLVIHRNSRRADLTLTATGQKIIEKSLETA